MLFRYIIVIPFFTFKIVNIINILLIISKDNIAFKFNYQIGFLIRVKIFNISFVHRNITLFVG